MLTYFLIFGGVLGGWSFLVQIGNERQRRVQERDVQQQRSQNPA
jgi:hypothetical protein